MRAVTAVDLFCGAGGLTAGLMKSGFAVVGALDSWDVAVRTYRLNFSHRVIKADIRSLSVEGFWRRLGVAPCRIDLLAGGPPCQGFSVQRIGPDEDSRNNLIFEFARFVVEMQPRMFLMENVPGILGRRGRRDTTRFQEMLLDGGYDVRAELVNAAKYGVPQLRKRVFLYGWLANAACPFAFPPPTRGPSQFSTVWEAIGDLPSPPADHAPLPVDLLHRRTRLSPQNLERLRLIPPGGGFESLPVHLRVDCHKNGAKHIGHRYVYGRLDPNRPAATLTARFDSFTRGKFGHPFEDRNITLREGARLQTFEDDFKFCGTQEEIAALIGNAVPPLLAEVMGRALRRHLSKALQQTLASTETDSAASSVQLRLFSPSSGV